MFRYIALIWNPRNPRQEERACAMTLRLHARPDTWHLRLSASGLAVFSAGERRGSSESYVIQANPSEPHGVALGKLFRQDADAASVGARVEIAPQTAREIIESAGRALISRFWGRYVAFIHNAESSTTHVLRDPSGSLPCFLAAIDDVSIVFSRADDLSDLASPSFSLNWSFIAAYVCYPQLVQSGKTGMNEVTEIQAGQRYTIVAGVARAQELLWNPDEIMERGRIEDLDEAVERLRATVATCVAGWASCYPRIVLLLSGGLDSSIVLSCLANAPSHPIVKGLTYYSTLSRMSDERRFARLVSSSLGCELVEAEVQPTHADLRCVLAVPQSPTPWHLQYDALHGRTERKVASETHASAIFYGVGGDQLFYVGPLDLVPADYFRVHGPGLGFLRASMAVARSERCSVWSVIRGAVKDGKKREAGSDPVIGTLRPRTLATPEALRSFDREEYLVHPWIRSARAAPWGKRGQIRQMSVSHGFQDPLAPLNAPERVCPLLSQPLMELAIRIPIYVLSGQGRNRNAVRFAFEDDLPREIVHRREKGAVDPYFQQILLQNVGFARDVLLDGMLVQHGFLDRKRMERALSLDRVTLGLEASEILVYHLGTEAWLQRLHASAQRRVA